VGTLLQDVKYGLRMLAKNPGFTAVAVLTLALGIGANTAIFSVINGVFLRPLPYPQPQRLVYAMWEWKNEPIDSIGGGDFVFWKEHSTIFENAGAYQPISGFNLVADKQARFVKGSRVSAGLFETLGVRPLLGRAFLEEEDRPDGPGAVVLGYGIWQGLFAGNPHLVGSTIRLNGSNYTVVGVMPAAFDFAASADVYVPARLVMNPNDHDQNYGMVGRLKPGVTLAAANADFQAAFQQFKQQYPEAVPEGWKGLGLIPYQKELTGDLRTPLFVLFGSAALVLLIAVVNLTNLFLGRALARQPEIAVRAALGAGRLRIARQLLTEGLLLSLIGGGLGSWLALEFLGWLPNLVPGTLAFDFGTALIPLGGQVRLDKPVLGFALLISLCAGIAAGLLPSFQFSRLNLIREIKEGGRTTSRSQGQTTRQILVVAELALSMVLLAGAGLLAKSAWKLGAVNPGFEAKNLRAVEMSLPAEQYKTTAQVVRFSQRVSERLRALPRVTAVAAVSNLPVERGLNFPQKITGCGYVGSLQLRAVSPGYFSTMGIPLLRGRDFQDSDGPTSAPVAIVNQALLRRCWPNGDALGRLVLSKTISGVVGDTREQGLDNPAPPTVFVPQAQLPNGLTQAIDGWFLPAWVLRTGPGFDDHAVERAIAEVDSAQPVAKIRSMNEVIANSYALAKNRFLSLLVGAFSLVALVLAVIGIYGVIAYSVVQRTHEFGIRIALGAWPREILGLVLGNGLRLILVGVGIGIGGALALTRFISALLYGVKASDPFTLALATLALSGVALVALIIPARRAAKVDPMVALRYE
jgi:putative ABC transport system permease protein